MDYSLDNCVPAANAGGRKTAGNVLAESIAAHEVDRVFCVPGESYLGLLDALFDRPDIDVVTCRHEGSAGFMALADARLSGRPAILCVSRGPGASNAVIAVHTAQQDAVPFILLVGQVASQDIRRDAFQEINYGKMFYGIAKWAVEVTDPGRVGEAFLRAWRVATSGVPGPVVLALPEDVLTATSEASPVYPQAPIIAGVPTDAADLLSGWLAESARPLVIAGRDLDVPGGREALLRFAEEWNVPVAVSFRRHDLFPNDHPLYAGDLGLANEAGQLTAFRTADLLIALGTRLGDITTQGYSFPRLVHPEMRLVHVHSDHGVLGTHFATDLALACPPLELLGALSGESATARDPHWNATLQRLRAKGSGRVATDASDGIPFEHVIEAVAARLSENATVTVDAGTFAGPIYRAIAFKPPQRLLAPISGAMGFGIPAAVAASLRDPRRQVVCFVGDGGLLMTCAELAVAAERGLPLKVIVSDNGSYGSIRIHQERDYPGRVVGTTLANPQLAELGGAYGFAVTCINSVAQMDDLLKALEAPGPQFIVVKTSLSAVLPKPPAELLSEVRT